MINRAVVTLSTPDYVLSKNQQSIIKNHNKTNWRFGKGFKFCHGCLVQTIYSILGSIQCWFGNS